jgi:hypothetical protein
MANPTNTVDIHDPVFETTHADLITDKVDRIPTTRVQSQQHANQHWGDFVDDFILAVVAQGLAPRRLEESTTDATPTTMSPVVHTMADGSAAEVEVKAWGRVGPQDYIFRHIRSRFERAGGSITEDVDFDSGNEYSVGGTLSPDGAVDIIVSGNDLVVEVTGKAATAITWRVFVSFLEVLP